MSSSAGKEVALRETKAITVLRTNAAVREEIAAALPQGLSLDRFVRTAQTTLREHPELDSVDQRSLFNAVVRCAQDGLLPDGRQAAIVKFGNAAGYLPMIGGFRQIAGEHGWALHTAVVREGEPFEYEQGSNERLRHQPDFRDQSGAIVAAYAIATHRDGRKLMKVLGHQEIAEARAVAKTQDVWKKWPAQMSEKTVGKRLFKELPLDPKDERIARLMRADELDTDEGEALLYGPPIVGDPQGTADQDSGAASSADAPDEASGDQAGAATTGASPSLDASPPDWPEEPPIENPGGVLFTRLRHEGVSIADVWALDEKYVRWAANEWPEPEVKDAAAAYVAQQEGADGAKAD